jgi:hypothetical protein
MYATPDCRRAVMDIMVWLRSLGLGRYEAAFRENEIDETVLPSLTHETLKELGVTVVGHRTHLTSPGRSLTRWLGLFVRSEGRLQIAVAGREAARSLRSTQCRSLRSRQCGQTPTSGVAALPSDLRAQWRTIRHCALSGRVLGSRLLAALGTLASNCFRRFSGTPVATKR